MHFSPQLQSDATRRPAAMHPSSVISFTPLPHRPSPTVHQQQPAFLQTLRKFIHSFYRNALPKVGNDEFYDPLDVCLFYFLPSTMDMTIALQFPATSSFPLNHSLSAQAVTHVQSGVHSDDNRHLSFTVLQSRAAAVPHPSATIIISRLSGWWPIHTGPAPPPIIDVPMTQGKKVSLSNLHHCL